MSSSQNWESFWKRDRIHSRKEISWSKKRILAILSPFAISGKKVLDAGCGSGFFSEYFCERGMKTVSVDYSSEALKMTQGRTQGRAQVLRVDLTKDDLGNVQGVQSEKFDLIFTDGLFEHFTVEQQHNIMTNFKNVLSPHGVIVTFVPNKWSPWQLIRPFFMPGIEEKPFTLQRLADLNHHCGLEIIRGGGVNVLPFRFSPDRSLGVFFGMLIFSLAKFHK